MPKKTDKRVRHDIPSIGWSKCRRFYNGKPFEHWQRMADKLVIETLVRAANPDATSIVIMLACEKLTHLAKALDPVIYAEVCDERDRCMSGLAALMGEITSPGAPPIIRNAVESVNLHRRRD